MQLLKYYLAFTSVIASTAALAQSDTVEYGPPPAWVTESERLAAPEDASGLFFIERQDALVHLDSAGQSNFVGQTYKLLHPQALQLGNISLEWDPAAGRPIVHRVLIHRDGQTIDVLEKTGFEILRREDQLEQALLDGKLTAVLRVPDLRVGDELEFAATTRTQDPSLRELSYGALFLGDVPPPGRIRLGLSWEDGQEPNIKLPPALTDIATRSSNAFDIRVDNAKPLAAPIEAPLRYALQRVSEYSDFARWEDLSAKVSIIFNAPSRLKPDSPLTEEVKRIAAASADPMERAKAALKLVQEQVRYIYVGLDGGNITPASADLTWERRYGDCKGKTVLLLALLRELGVEAEAVLANNGGLDDGLDQRLPSPAAFDHVLVRAKIDGKHWWLDGTFPGDYPPLVRPLLNYRWVLPLSQKGSALERLPATPPQLPLEMGLYEIDASGGFDVPAHITSTRVVRGVDGLVLHSQLSALTKDQLETGMRNSLASDPNWDEIESVDYRFDRMTQAGILTIRGTGKANWDDDGDGAYSMSLVGGGFNPPTRKQRPSDQDQTAPYYSTLAYSCYATTVKLPKDTALDNWGFNSVFDTMIFGRLYYRMMERRVDGTIRMVRGSRVEEAEISAEKAKRDNGRIDDFDNSKANIYYDPANKMNAWGQLRPVPASTDSVWLGSNPPCLPPDVAP
ncbi:DUF3857 domain-containing protein [Erythrobacter mangrovi]|uniref:DUF3857 domain-containing transglutaminase family protein n=1 Tax=Erythrobacter mangrovi TaxID=2739433 RepID=A0A7D3XG64_9SPHN|nr:DUF3857 domain-containing transglutaminase family protein [Erythrobacter mangrovi]QKG69998.1 DUF3857 domain-containing transglutaminase family protein [Erythrobacter mangrovi]